MSRQATRSGRGRRNHAPDAVRAPPHNGREHFNKNCELFVDRLPADVSEAELRDAFEYNDIRVRHATIHVDEHHWPYARVWLYDTHSVNDALAKARRRSFRIREQVIFVGRARTAIHSSRHWQGRPQPPANIRVPEPAASSLPIDSVAPCMSQSSCTSDHDDTTNSTENSHPSSPDKRDNSTVHSNPNAASYSYDATAAAAAAAVGYPGGTEWPAGHDCRLNTATAEAMSAMNANAVQHGCPQHHVPHALHGEMAENCVGGHIPHVASYVCPCTCPHTLMMPHRTANATIYYPVTQYPMLVMCVYDPAAQLYYPVQTLSPMYVNVSHPHSGIPYCDTRSDTVVYLPTNSPIDVDKVTSTENYEKMVTVQPQVHTFTSNVGSYSYGTFHRTGPTATPAVGNNVTGTQHNAESTQHNAESTQHGAASTQHDAASTPHCAASTQHGAASTPHCAASTQHGAASTQHCAASTQHGAAERQHNGQPLDNEQPPQQEES